jgi:hypothetical protein
MKYIIYLLIFFGFPFCLTAQETRVGIGTTDPQEALDVEGRIVAQGYNFSSYYAEASPTSYPGDYISTGSGWNDFPNLSTSFQLMEPTTIMAAYSLGVGAFGSQSACFRFNINGTGYAPYILHITASGTTQWNTISNNFFMELPAGNHTVKIEYYTLEWPPMVYYTDEFKQSYLQVLVFGTN